MRWIVVVGLTVGGCAQKPRAMVVSRPAYAQPYCVRTLGVAECFANPADLPDHPPQLEDTPVRSHPADRPWYAMTWVSN
jgi:hypothetical protein